jgi:hypothetical protein
MSQTPTEPAPCFLTVSWHLDKVPDRRIAEFENTRLEATFFVDNPPCEALAIHGTLTVVTSRTQQKTPAQLQEWLRALLHEATAPTPPTAAG